MEVLKAPSVVYEFPFTAVASEPAMPYESSGAYTIVMIVSDFEQQVGVVFGSSEDMDEATETTSFPVAWDEYRRFRVSPAAPYFSVIGLDGASGTLLYYIEGETA